MQAAEDGLGRPRWGGKILRTGEGVGGDRVAAHLLLQSLHLGHQMLLFLFLSNPGERTKAVLGPPCPHIALVPSLGTHLGSGSLVSKAGRMGLGALIAPAVPFVIRGMANRAEP